MIEIAVKLAGFEIVRCDYYSTRKPSCQTRVRRLELLVVHVYFRYGRIFSSVNKAHRHIE